MMGSPQSREDAYDDYKEEHKQHPKEIVTKKLFLENCELLRSVFDADDDNVVFSFRGSNSSPLRVEVCFC